FAVALSRYVEPRQWIVLVRIEPGRHQEQFGLKGIERRSDLLLPCPEERSIRGACRKRHVEDIPMHAALTSPAGAGIERILMSRGVEDVGVALEAVLGAVAVMDVEVENRDATNA